MEFKEKANQSVHLKFNPSGSQSPPKMPTKARLLSNLSMPEQTNSAQSTNAGCASFLL